MLKNKTVTAGRLVDRNLKLADQLFRKLLPTVPRELLGLDITMAQLKICLMLFIGGPQRMSTIAAGMEVTLPTATSLVDRLVEKHYVTRESLPEDRRVVICRLADEGEKALSGIWESSRKRSMELLQSLSNRQLTMFVEILEAMLKSANENLPDPGARG